MIAGGNYSANAGDVQGKFGSGGGRNIGKLAASAFLTKNKQADDEHEPEGLGNLLDQRRINEIFVRLKTSEIVCLFFALFGIGSGVIDYEISYTDTNEAEKSTRITLEWFWVVSTIWVFITLIFRYNIVLDWYKARGIFSTYDTLVNTGLYKYLLVELALNLITPFPFIWNTNYSETYDDYNTTVKYRVNDIFLLTMCLLRTYHLVRCSLTLSHFMDTRSQRVCNMSGSDASFMFSIKSLMKKQPYAVLIWSLLLSIILFGFILRIFERPLSAASSQDFNNINNALWVTLITMTTVGYGDFFPKSNIGRFVGIMIAFWGVAFVSLFVVTLTNLLAFENGEEKSFLLLQRLKSKDDLKREAVNVMVAAFRQKRVKKAYPDDLRKNINAVRNFRGHMLKFQAISRSIRGNYESETDADRIKRDLEELREDVDFIRDNLLQICKCIGIEEKEIENEIKK